MIACEFCCGYLGFILDYVDWWVGLVVLLGLGVCCFEFVSLLLLISFV